MQPALVLCYHAMDASWPSAVPAERLRKHAEILLRRGLVPATFTDIVTEDSGGGRFAITFDDGYASVLERAFPVLERLNVPATVFVVTAFADEGAPLTWPGQFEPGVRADEHARRSLTWAGLRQLADAGWEIGSHTCTHPRLTQLDDASLDRELRGSRAACTRRLGAVCRSIAYPFGDVDERVVSAARSAGYEAGCSLSIHTSGPLAWPRIGVYGKDVPARFKLKVSPTIRALRRLRGRATASAQ